jgi:hypothetical protein
MNIASEYNIDENSIMTCPFCGSVAELRQVGTSGFVVRCKNRACLAEQAARLTPMASIELWNKRVYMYPNAI